MYDIEASRYLNIDEKYRVIIQLGLEGVPHAIPQIYAPNALRGQKVWLDIADGLSYLTNPPIDWIETGGEFKQYNMDKPVLREGIVIRDVDDDSFSFKAISNKFLLKGGE